VAGAGAGAGAFGGVVGAVIGFWSGALHWQPHPECSDVPHVLHVDAQQVLHFFWWQPHELHPWAHVLHPVVHVELACAQHGVSQQPFRLPNAQAESAVIAHTVSNTTSDIAIRRIVRPPANTG
jgi:hypothetical protein